MFYNWFIIKVELKNKIKGERKNEKIKWKERNFIKNIQTKFVRLLERKKMQKNSTSSRINLLLELRSTFLKKRHNIFGTTSKPMRGIRSIVLMPLPILCFLIIPLGLSFIILLNLCFHYLEMRETKTPEQNTLLKQKD